MTDAVLRRLQRQLVAAAISTRPEVPDAGRLLWRAFIVLHNARVVTMAGAQAISFADIEAYARVERLPLRTDHVAILRAMDDAWLGKARATAAAGSGAKEKRVSTQEVSPELFDAVFG